ncbi:MAG TPA: ATP-binding cassette domain-containing protein, partial [Candidatus Dormibacteraeota bacterium]|nr:ATP-binding cassette domain-containing protein [Candidatus Dormibacteraeota bacterium]
MGSRPATTGRNDTSTLRVDGNGARPTARLTRERIPTNGHVAPEPDVKVVGVAKSFGKRQVLKGINLVVAPGELVEVTGPSGSGKTTFLRLLHGQLRPNAGEVLVRGRRLNGWWRRNLGGLRRNVAFVYQEQRLLPRLNAFENVMLA